MRGLSDRTRRFSWALVLGACLGVCSLVLAGGFLPATAAVPGGAGSSGAGLGLTLVGRCPPCFLTINLTGLPTGSTATAAVSGVNNGTPVTSDTGAFTFGNLSNGTYQYVVFGPAGYVSSNGTSAGNVTIAGQNVSVQVAFEKGTSDRLTLLASGLPANTTWCATFSQAMSLCTEDGTGIAGAPQPAGSAPRAHEDLEFADVTPATYKLHILAPPGYAAKLPPPSSVDLANGSVTYHIRYVAVEYGLTFDETGLAAGTHWTVSLTKVNDCPPLCAPFPKHGERAGSRGSSIAFSVANGTYTYAVRPVVGYVGDLTGQVTVNGGATTHDVTFTAVAYAVTFSETGLPPGTTWGVTIGNQTYSTNASSIVVNLTDGTYHYSIQSPAGYTERAAPATVRVHGAPVSVTVKFRAA